VYVPLSFSDLEAQIVRRRADADLPSCLPSPEHLRNGIVMETVSTVHMRSLGFIDATGPLETAAGEAAAEVVEAVEAMVEAMAATAVAAAAAAGSEAARLAAAACSKALRLAARLTPTILYPRPDGGFDIIASEAVAQCKFRSSGKTPPEDVEQFANDCDGDPLGKRARPGTLEHRQKCRLFYASDVSRETARKANEMQIAVFLVNDKTGAVRPYNDCAFALGLAADVQRGGDLSPEIDVYWSRLRLKLTDVSAANKGFPAELLAELLEMVLPNDTLDAEEAREWSENLSDAEKIAVQCLSVAEFLPTGPILNYFRRVVATSLAQRLQAKRKQLRSLFETDAGANLSKETVNGFPTELAWAGGQLLVDAVKSVLQLLPLGRTAKLYAGAKLLSKEPGAGALLQLPQGRTSEHDAGGLPPPASQPHAPATPSAAPPATWRNGPESQLQPSAPHSDGAACRPRRPLQHIPGRQARASMGSQLTTAQRPMSTMPHSSPGTLMQAKLPQPEIQSRFLPTGQPSARHSDGAACRLRWPLQPDDMRPARASLGSQPMAQPSVTSTPRSSLSGSVAPRCSAGAPKLPALRALAQAPIGRLGKAAVAVAALGAAIVQRWRQLSSQEHAPSAR
jgi:hypothetical protein